MPFESSSFPMNLNLIRILNSILYVVVHKNMDISLTKYLLLWISYALKRKRNRLRFLLNPLENLDPSEAESIHLIDLTTHEYSGELNLTHLRGQVHTGISGWVKRNGPLNRLFKQKYVHIHHPIDVFQVNSCEEKFFGSYNDLHESAEIVRVDSAILSTRSFPENLSKYRCSIRKAPDPFQIKGPMMSIDSALVLDIGGGEFFQHFLLDLLPVLNSVRKFLVSNNDVKIMLPAPLPSFRNFQDWIKLLGLKNEVVVFPSDRKINWAVNRLFFVKFYPYNYGANSSSLYQSLHQTLNPNTLDNSMGLITYIRRNTPMLNRGYVSNEEEVISRIQSICSKRSLTFQVIDPTTATLLEIKQTLNNSKVAISLHGGAGLNAIFLPAGSTFIEALNIKNCNTFAHLMLSCGINYLPLSNDFQHYDREITFPITELDSLFNDVL